MSCGMLMIAAGFGSMPETPTWERIVWLVIGLVFVANIGRSLRPEPRGGAPRA